MFFRTPNYTYQCFVERNTPSNIPRELWNSPSGELVNKQTRTNYHLWTSKNFFWIIVSTTFRYISYLVLLSKFIQLSSLLNNLIFSNICKPWEIYLPKREYRESSIQKIWLVVKLTKSEFLLLKKIEGKCSTLFVHRAES